MSPQAGNLLVQEVAPRIKAVSHHLRYVAPEDPEELAQDGMAIAAKMLHNAEANHKKVSASNIAYYSLQHLKSGRRSVGHSNADVLGSATQLNGRSKVHSFQCPLPTQEEEFGDLIESEGQDPSQQAARHLDWQEFMSKQDDRSRAFLIFLAEGKQLNKIALKLRCSATTLQTCRRELARGILEFMGQDVLALAAKEPEWKSNLLAVRERQTSKIFPE